MSFAESDKLHLLWSEIIRSPHSAQINHSSVNGSSHTSYQWKKRGEMSVPAIVRLVQVIFQDLS